ncbi:Response regulator protein vraR [Actinomyces bovis]|uniref:Response regulator protein vraR n=1 Tax=Actinomyces bovis TaxID=1658 RepID=A0ABY1VP18_9ACTO|nr:response regulator transcription factor [Actinomyces bovis]SPT52813.1 Response regulator protein vraR [Actinomyces bovis]VEG54864.1 Response regulator protein vraR [Actinomyces israelii]
MKVLVVDDDALVAQSLATILSVEPDIEVVGTGSSGPEAVELYGQLHPDVLLLDIQMPGGDGLAAAEQVLRAQPEARVVFLTTFSDDEYIVRALRMGARGYLIKQDIAQIAPALRGVMAGVSVLEGQVLERGVLPRGSHGATGKASDGEAEAASEASRAQRRRQVFGTLTDREFEVVEAVAEGLDNAEVASRLCMSEGTVRNHISAMLAKLGLRNRTQLAVRYYRGES